MKGTIRAFSLGLFVAGIMIVVSFLFIGDTATSKKDAEDFPLEDMIEIMKDEGYRVVTEEEYITLSLADNNEQEVQSEENNDDNEQANDNNKEEKSEHKNDDESDEDKKDEEDEEDEEDKVEKYTIHIKDGMASSEIGELLEENNIIDDSSKFNKYLEDEGYHKGVQLGKFDVTSDMDFKEIAKAITR